MILACITILAIAAIVSNVAVIILGVQLFRLKRSHKDLEDFAFAILDGAINRNVALRQKQSDDMRAVYKAIQLVVETTSLRGKNNTRDIRFLYEQVLKLAQNTNTMSERLLKLWNTQSL